jgi:hypothetical protein
VPGGPWHLDHDTFVLHAGESGTVESDKGSTEIPNLHHFGCGALSPRTIVSIPSIMRLIVDDHRWRQQLIDLAGI